MPRDWLQELEEQELEEEYQAARQAANDAAPKLNGGTPPEGRPLPALLLSEWLARDIPDPDFLLGEWLSTSSRVLVIGPTGLGKTLWGIDLGISLAAGADFLHWRTARPCRVLYIDGEMSRRLLKKRLRDAVKRAGGQPETFMALSKEDFPDMPPLNTPKGYKWLNSFVGKRGPFDLIIFDNIQALLVGDMREEEQWAKVLPLVRALTRSAIGQIWFHHTGHDETKGYGSKAREWQMDTVALMERKTIAGTDVAFTLKFTKARERTPDNRADFEDTTLSLRGDQWTHDQAAREPTGQAKIALEQLKRAVADAGEKPPASNHIPGTIEAVPLSLWRGYFYKVWVGEGDTREDSEKAYAARKKAFQRAVRTLQAAEKIGLWDPWVWPT